jgi:hypothetical protein
MGTETRHIDCRDAPPFLGLSEFPPPGILQNRAPAPLTDFSFGLGIPTKLSSVQSGCTAPATRAGACPSIFKADVFGRLIARIAHATAVAQFGLNSFNPYLPDIILGADTNIGFLIGGAAPSTEPTQLPAGKQTFMAHELSMRVVVPAENKFILASTVRLFAFTGSPTYWAIICEPGPEILEHLEVPAAPTP